MLVMVKCKNVCFYISQHSNGKKLTIAGTYRELISLFICYTHFMRISITITITIKSIVKSICIAAFSIGSLILYSRYYFAVFLLSSAHYKFTLEREKVETQSTLHCSWHQSLEHARASALKFLIRTDCQQLYLDLFQFLKSNLGAEKY